MDQNPTSPAPSLQTGSTNGLVNWLRSNPLPTLLLLTCSGVFLYFYAFIPLFGNYREQSVTYWIWAVCGKKEYDYEHGRFVPVVIAFLIYRARHDIAKAPRSSEWWGLALLIVGIFFYIIAARTIQARVAAGSIPFVIYGFIAYTWGRHVAKHFFFPLAMLYFAIPLPGLTQATNGLQVLATQIAAFLSNLVGADVIPSGTAIKSATGDWDDLKIAEGCSGVRSLIALTFISAVYAHITQDRLWKKLFIMAASVPLAIFANALRVTTIVIIADYWSAEFASKTYHNFSGFIFFPLGLAGLLLLGFLINGGWKRAKASTSTRVVTSQKRKAPPEPESESGSQP